MLIIKTTRFLNNAEKDLVRAVFLAQINCDNVQLIKGYWLKYCLPRSRMPIAPNGNVYFHANDFRYSDDFCGVHDDVESIAKSQYLLIHEMTHVWQFQQNVNVLWLGFILHAWYQPLYPLLGKLIAFFPKLKCLQRWKKLLNIYRYHVQSHRFNIEQQAQIFADYFLLTSYPETKIAKQLVKQHGDFDENELLSYLEHLRLALLSK